MDYNYRATVIQSYSISSKLVPSPCAIYINIETVSCPWNTCFWYARALAVKIRHEAEPSDVFLTASARACQKHALHGQETVSIFTANLHAIFNNILLSFIADYDSERVCRWGVFLNSGRRWPMGSTPFDAFPFWMIFCHISDITLERSWVIDFCLHFCWMYVATAIIYCDLRTESFTARSEFFFQSVS